MSDQAVCVRCRGPRTPIERAPYPGALGREIVDKVCAGCWGEWQKAEVMIINELRLNFMDPRSQEILVQHLREFLALDGPGGAGGGIPGPGSAPPGSGPA